MLFTEAQQAFKKYMIYHEMSSETVKGYMKDLRTFNRFITDKYNSLIYVEDITVDDVEEYMYYLVDERELAPRSRNRYLFSLRSFFNYAVKKQWVDRNVAAEVDPVKVMEEKKVALTKEEIDELLNMIEHPVIHFAVALMAYSGMRVIEAKGLKMSDIDFEYNQFLVNGKGRQQRYVPIAKTLKPYLDDYLNNIRGDIDSDYVLATTKTGRLSAGYINNILHKATDKLGWDKKVTCHTLRRSFATNLLREGVNVFAISKLLGHRSLKTTTVYLQLNENELQTAVDKL
ncbi:tyrosine-type recombinase/integrase [Caldifermentibacillus hisashii]|uniref:tyrosine-type recombinase/integrase n=1 Tax=Caldifermentibacillus hisashii TaxID=996558 RepID=UPI0031FCDFE6